MEIIKINYTNSKRNTYSRSRRKGEKNESHFSRQKDSLFYLGVLYNPRTLSLPVPLHWNLVLEQARYGEISSAWWRVRKLRHKFANPIDFGVGMSLTSSYSLLFFSSIFVVPSWLSTLTNLVRRYRVLTFYILLYVHL